MRRVAARRRLFSRWRAALLLLLCFAVGGAWRGLPNRNFLKKSLKN
jgi:hypothetical protein